MGVSVHPELPMPLAGPPAEPACVGSCSRIAALSGRAGDTKLTNILMAYKGAVEGSEHRKSHELELSKYGQVTNANAIEIAAQGICDWEE